MSEAHQDAATVAKPAPAESPSPVTERPVGPVSEHEWMKRRKEERRAAREAIQTVTPSPEQPEPTPETPTPEVAEDPPSQPSQSPDEPETDAQAEAEPDAPQPEVEGEFEFPDSMSSLAEAIGMEDPSEFLNLKDVVTVNGQEQEVTLKDLKESFSSKSERDRLYNELSDSQKAFEAERETQQRELNARVEQMDSLLTMMHQEINAGASEEQIAQLLAEGKAEEAMRAKLQRDSQLQKFNQVVNARNNLRQQQETERQTKVAEYRQKQQQALLSRKSDLKDPTKLAAYENRIRAGLTQNFGYTEQDVDQFFQSFDERSLRVIEAALDHTDLKSKAKPIKKQVKKAVKLAKAGAPRTAAQKSADARQSSRASLRKSVVPGRSNVQDGIKFLREQRQLRRATSDGS